jgi:Protein HRI1
MPTEPTLPITTIDWAFAGTSSTSPATDSKPEHTVWTHWVDSTTPDGEAVKDEGDMITLESGELVERGQMVNPRTLEGY